MQGDTPFFRVGSCFSISDVIQFQYELTILILRSRPDVVENWDDSEVARRWLMLCPKRKKPDKSPEEPNEFELNSIRNDPDKLVSIRKRQQVESGNRCQAYSLTIQREMASIPETPFKKLSKCTCVYFSEIFVNYSK